LYGQVTHHHAGVNGEYVLEKEPPFLRLYAGDAAGDVQQGDAGHLRDAGPGLYWDLFLQVILSLFYQVEMRVAVTYPVISFWKIKNLGLIIRKRTRKQIRRVSCLRQVENKF
jgi:hypothetical protein